MSIYASRADVGLYPESSRTNGDVLAYQRSHVFPSPDHPHAAIFTASIPGHCVPGQDDDDFEHDARYLRLDVADGTNGHFITSTVVLTERGAQALRDELDAWLARPKLDPATGRSA